MKRFRGVLSLVLSLALVVNPAIAKADWWETASSAWDSTKAACNKTIAVASEAYDTTTTWCGEHQEEIVGTAVAVGTAVVIAAMNNGQAPPAKAAPAPVPVRGRAPVIAPGKDFSGSQKRAALGRNALNNGGVIKSDISGGVLLHPQKHVKGVTPPGNEAHVDHIIPRSLGGTNSLENAQVISRSENLAKGAKMPSGVIINEWPK